MSSVRLAASITIGMMALGVVAGCSAPSPVAREASPSGPATAPSVVAATSREPAVPGEIAQAAPEPVIVDCTQSGQVRPGAYVITCADANTQLTNLQWTSWGPQTASAVGQMLMNDCTPTCVAGHDQTYPVRVTLSNPAAWSGHKTARFTTMTVDYPGARPARTSGVVAIQLPE
jgi:hypothetical protein